MADSNRAEMPVENIESTNREGASGQNAVEPNSVGMPIGKKLQIILLVPLLLGIVISCVFVLTIVFVSQSSWLSDTKSYIQVKEIDFMYTLSQTAGSELESLLTNSWYYINFMSQLYNATVSKNILNSASATKPNVINAYNSMNYKAYPVLNYSVWLSGNSADLSSAQINNLIIPDSFMRLVYKSLNTFNQLGLIIDKGKYEYLYPLTNMSYINYQNVSKTCPSDNTNVYDPTCTYSYTLLQNSTLNHVLNIYYENNNLIMQQKSDYGAAVGMLPNNYFSSKLTKNRYYNVFASQYLGYWTLYSSTMDASTMPEGSNNIYNALYSDPNSISDFQNFVFPVLRNKNGTTRTGINGDITYFAFSNMNISIMNNQENAYVMGVSRKESDVYSTWNNFMVKVYNITIIQSGIFAIFFVLTLIIAWRLALMIVHRVTEPLNSITGYLSKNDPPLNTIQKSFNSQINSVLDNLSKLQTIEEFIDPSFLLNPVFEVRLKNLKIAKKLFKSIQNKRGKSIVYNLLGNAEFSKIQYEKAEHYYTKSLESLEELMLEIEKQEQEEQNLSISEKNLLRTKRDDFKESWEDEKRFVRESMCEKLQQICMALTMKLKEDSDQVLVMRSKWKELIKIQTKILQYYESSRESYIKYLKLLLDMSEVYQTLQYYHTAFELLEIIGEELWKIDIDKKAEIDIDVNRLRKIGIDIKETDKIACFQIKTISFEKDILMQNMLYRRGMIQLDNNRYQKAALDFTLALESGNYYDPKIRRECINELYSIMNKFGIISLAPDLKNMHIKQELQKKSVVFLLSYDLYSNPQISNQIVKYFNLNLNNTDMKIAVIAKNNKLRYMDLYERDFPGMDLENLIIQSQTGDDNENFIDLMHKAIDILVGNKDSNIVVFHKASSEKPAVGSLKTLQELMTPNIKLLFVNFGVMEGLDIEIFLENNNATFLNLKDKPFSECFTELNIILDSKLSNTR